MKKLISLFRMPRVASLQRDALEDARRELFAAENDVEIAIARRRLYRARVARLEKEIGE